MLSRTTRMTGLVVMAAVAALAVLWALFVLTPRPAAADSPHVSAGPTTGGCAACHRAHSGQNNWLVKDVSESTVCFSCHDGTGSNYNVAAEYNDANVPADDPDTRSYYAHRLDTGQAHVSAKVRAEFSGVLNRHSACSDCHNPHAVNSAAPAQTGFGWTASGALNNITGVNAEMGWQYPITLEYQLCFKCHSRYTVLLSSTTPTHNKTDKAAELDPNTASYHPVEAPGKNTTNQMQESLDGGKLWRLTTTSTIRCTMCHGDYRLVGNPPAPGTPAPEARLAPHTSRYRSLLIANYRDRDLKPAAEAYATNDFDLCYLCHSEAPFTDVSGDARSDTNFRFHGYHASKIDGQGGRGTDINILGDGQGNAICAECHFETHGTKLAPWAANQTYSRGVNFAPNVEPRSGQIAPVWDVTSRSCALVCHEKDHDPKTY